MMKILGFMKISECISKIEIIKKEYDEKISHLNEYIDDVERKNRVLKESNKNLSNQNRDLQIELLNKDKEIRYLKKALSGRTYIALSDNVAWELAKELAKQ